MTMVSEWGQWASAAALVTAHGDQDLLEAMVAVALIQTLLLLREYGIQYGVVVYR